jgi:hypothetical protein
MAALFIIMAFFLACLRGSSDRRCDDVSSVAFWYQAEPHSIFPPLPSVEQRLPIFRSHLNDALE